MRTDVFRIMDYETGEETEHRFPTRNVVCWRCGGDGTHTNPSIDGHGITMDEWYGPDWDEDSREAYLTGRYDVTCEECHGRRVLPEIDESVLTDAQRTLYETFVEQEAERAQWEAEDAYTRRMESGGY